MCIRINGTQDKCVPNTIDHIIGSWFQAVWWWIIHIYEYGMGFTAVTFILRTQIWEERTLIIIISPSPIRWIKHSSIFISSLGLITSATAAENQTFSPCWEGRTLAPPSQTWSIQLNQKQHLRTTTDSMIVNPSQQEIKKAISQWPADALST